MRVTRFRHGPAVAALALFGAACADSSPVDPYAGEPQEARKPRATLEVLAPTPGATLSGEVVFSARLQELPVTDYTMRWQVDGGQQNPMSPDADGSAHEARVDVTGWDWRGEGPYTVSFRAYDRKGRRVDDASVEIRVQQQPAMPGDTTVTDTASTTPTGNPLAGAVFWVDPYSNARKTADAWYATRPDDAAMMERVAAGPQADWYGDWTADVRSAVSERAAQIRGAGAVPVFVAYNIPLRDCNSYSGGGASSPDAYRTWIRDFAAGLGGGPAAVILEPDALAQLDCLGAAAREERLALLRDAVAVLTSATDAAVYLDAGHPRWHDASTTAQRLQAANVAAADGFALNVSNFISDADNVTYGRAVSDLLGGEAHFVIDASRNGVGPAADGSWCNPDERALGRYATAETGDARVDAFLWIKRPGESDGTCNGGPRAGAWWADYALGLAQRAPGSTVVAEE